MDTLALMNTSTRTDAFINAQAPPSNTTIQLFVVDDFPLILEAFSFMSDDELNVTGFSNIDELKDILKQKLYPDIILIDYFIPKFANIDALIELTTECKNCKIAIFSGNDDIPLVKEILKYCDGFIHKSMTLKNIYHAIKFIHNGGKYIPNFILQQTPIPPPSPPLHGNSYGFTIREIDTLRCLALGRTNKEIARELNIKEVTVKLHLRHSYEKMHVKNRVQAVKEVYAGALN